MSALILTPGAIANATTGVGVGAAPIQAAHSVVPASSVALPSLYVVNTGTEASTYGVQVMPIGKAKGLTVPASWVALRPGKIRLKPKVGTWVGVVLTVPAGAATGHYSSYLVAGTTTAGKSRGTLATFGGQAATELRFTVDAAKAKPAAGAATGTSRVTGSAPVKHTSGPVLWWMLALAAALLAFLAGWKKSGLRLQITRR